MKYTLQICKLILVIATSISQAQMAVLDTDPRELKPGYDNFRLGEQYLYAKGDWTQARNYFTLASQEGFDDAYVELGRMSAYEDDIKQAEKYLTLAALAGHREVYTNLEPLYRYKLKNPMIADAFALLIKAEDLMYGRFTRFTQLPFLSAEHGELTELFNSLTNRTNTLKSEVGVPADVLSVLDRALHEIKAFLIHLEGF